MEVDLKVMTCMHLYRPYLISIPGTRVVVIGDSHKMFVTLPKSLVREYRCGGSLLSDTHRSITLSIMRDGTGK